MPDLIITPPTVTAGSPAPTVEFTLTRGGANVLPEVAAGRITNAAAGDYTATWTATNGIGSPAVVTRTATVAAAPAIGGVPLGQAGATGTIYNGYVLADGDDFDDMTAADFLTPNSATGSYRTTRH